MHKRLFVFYTTSVTLMVLKLFVSQSVTTGNMDSTNWVINEFYQKYSSC